MNIYTVSIRLANGRAFSYNVMAADAMTGTEESPSAISKAQAKCLADNGAEGVVQSFSALAENVLE